MEREDLLGLTLNKSIAILLRVLWVVPVASIIVMTLSDLFSTNDTALSSSSILNEDNVQYEIRKNETKFRDDIYKNLYSLYHNESFSLIDSLGKNPQENDEIKKYVILTKLKSGKTKYSFIIKVDKLTSPIIQLYQLKTTFQIDFDKLSNIIKSSKLNEDSLKYGNYLKTDYEYNKRLRIDYLIIVIFAIIALAVIIYFVKRIGTKNKNELNKLIEKLDSDREAINQAKNILNENQISEDNIDVLKKLVTRIEENLATYEFDNVLESIFYIDVSKAERKSLELYNRSTLMLILGLLTAIVGIVVFYFTLPEFSEKSNTLNYLALTIRPTLLLLFVQSISFYLLRQYRSLINDYKYFYEEYLKKSKIFVAYQLMQNDNLSESELKLIDNLLSTDVKNKESVSINDENQKEKLFEMLKTLLEKFKNM